MCVWGVVQIWLCTSRVYRVCHSVCVGGGRVSYVSACVRRLGRVRFMVMYPCG